MYTDSCAVGNGSVGNQALKGAKLEYQKPGRPGFPSLGSLGKGNVDGCIEMAIKDVDLFTMCYSPLKSIL